MIRPSSNSLRRTRLRVESLEQRRLLSADGFDLAGLMPDIQQQLNYEIMEQLQQQAGQFGIDPTDLLRIPELRNPCDINLDGFVSPLDALLGINQLNQNGARQIPDELFGELGKFDMNLDGFISPLDPLRLINLLNSGDLPNGRWWEFDGGVSEIVADAMECLKGEVGENGLGGIDDRVGALRNQVDAHIDAMKQAVGAHLNGRGYNDGVDGLCDGLGQMKDLIHEHLAHLHELIGHHIDYVGGDFYHDLMPEGAPPLASDTVDTLLDGLVNGNGETSTDGTDCSTLWHLDYVCNLIDQHAGYLREGFDLGNIQQLIGTHADYIGNLLNIHDVNIPDLGCLGDIVDKVCQLTDWFDGQSEGEWNLPDIGNVLDGLDNGNILDYLGQHIRIPTSIQNHLDSLKNHVGYVQELIDAHCGIFNGDSEYDGDLSDLIPSHLGYVQELLGAHGLPSSLPGPIDQLLGCLPTIFGRSYTTMVY